MNIINIDNNKNLTTDLKKQLVDFLKNNKSIKLNLMDKTRGFYVTLEYKNQQVEVPFKYLLTNTNKKLNGIPYINFEITCSSKKKGYCSICNYCYSLLGQNLFKNNNYKIVLNVLFIQYIINEYNNRNLKPFNLLINYLKDAALIRFNCNNDFNSINDVKFLIELSKNLKYTVIYGYTKRLDFRDNIESLDVPNLIINSNYLELSKNGNTYVTTYDIQEYINSNYTCKGVCINCLKCTKKLNKNIYCLLHGPKNRIDPVFNTKNNRDYLIKFFNQKYNIGLKDSDLITNKGLLSSLNKFLRSTEYSTLQFKNIKELADDIKSFGGVQYE